MKNYYEILGVEQNATKADIKRNYRKLATKYHPDKNSEPTAASIFIAVTEAYEILSNRKSRAAYDLSRWQALKNKQANQDTFTTTPYPTESTRSRRNKAQEKRSTKYHKAKGETTKTLLLITESLYLLSRYILSILAITLMSVILFSASSQFLNEALSLGIRLTICVLVPLLAWGIFKIIHHLFSEIKKDIALFSIYYKITHQKACYFSIPVFIIALLLYLFILRSF